MPYQKNILPSWEFFSHRGGKGKNPDASLNESPKGKIQINELITMWIKFSLLAARNSSVFPPLTSELHSKHAYIFQCWID